MRNRLNSHRLADRRQNLLPHLDVKEVLADRANEAILTGLASLHHVLLEVVTEGLVPKVCVDSTALTGQTDCWEKIGRTTNL